MIETIHYQLKKAGIPHICHFGQANQIGAFDLGAAATLCTECRIDRGEFTLADILLERVDPLDKKKAYEESSRRYTEDRDLRLAGKLPRHILYTVQDAAHPYERYECKMEHGSAAATPERICFCCKKSIDE